MKFCEEKTWSETFSFKQAQAVCAVGLICIFVELNIYDLDFCYNCFIFYVIFLLFLLIF